MKVAILAGGFGTRLGEYTDSIPKPMVSIGGIPILWHILKRYADFGCSDFCIALGYKAEIIKQYFLNYAPLNSDFSINLATGKMDLLKAENPNWQVSLIDTGANTMTGGRVKRLQKLIGNETFFLTYGDGLADIDLMALLQFHRNHGKLVTVTAVRPAARFGELELDGDNVISFQEKPQISQGWINGGFFVIEPGFFKYLENDSTVLERAPLENAARDGQLVAFRHEGFWQCMDTKRDKDFLESIWSQGKAPWLLSQDRL